MTEQQQGPFSLQVEATEGCNLRCRFCGSPDQELRKAARSKP